MFHRTHCRLPCLCAKHTDVVSDNVVLTRNFSFRDHLHSAWITRTTASVRMGKGFATYQEASTTAGSPGSTGRIGSWRCTWLDWTPSRRRLASSLNHCLHICLVLKLLRDSPLTLHQSEELVLERHNRKSPDLRVDYSAEGKLPVNLDNLILLSKNASYSQPFLITDEKLLFLITEMF